MWLFLKSDAWLLGGIVFGMLLDLYRSRIDFMRRDVTEWNCWDCQDQSCCQLVLCCRWESIYAETIDNSFSLAFSDGRGRFDFFVFDVSWEIRGFELEVRFGGIRPMSRWMSMRTEEIDSWQGSLVLGFSYAWLWRNVRSVPWKPREWSNHVSITNREKFRDWLIACRDASFLHLPKWVRSKTQNDRCQCLL